MLYLLDANALIDPKNKYYPLERVPEFWDFLGDQGQQGNIKIPQEIYNKELQGKGDDLAAWLEQSEVKKALLLEAKIETSEVEAIKRVYFGLKPPTDKENEDVGQDPFLIAYANRDKKLRCVVTTEVSKPTRQRANRHIPDICRDLNIDCCNVFELIKRLDFRTAEGKKRLAQ